MNEIFLCLLVSVLVGMTIGWLGMSYMLRRQRRRKPFNAVPPWVQEDDG